jgi:hypothetical protein
MTRGRKKGVKAGSSFMEISYEDLGLYYGKKAIVKVSRTELESLMPKEEPQKQVEKDNDLQYKITDLNEL